jgi:hypothetical protein
MSLDTSDTHVEQILREAGSQWRAGAEAMPSLDDIQIGAMQYSPRATRPSQRRLFAAVTAAIGVAALVIAGQPITRDDGHRTPEGASAASPTGCDAANIVVGELRASPGPSGTSIAVTFTYRGDQPCTVSGGGPAVRLVDDQQAVLVAGGQAITPVFRNITITSGETLHFTALWSSWCGPAPTRAMLDFNIAQGAPDWWVSTSHSLTADEVPPCQTGQSAIVTYQLLPE